MNIKNIGTVYGGWSKIPIDNLDSHSIIYSFGAGEDICYEFLLSGITDAEIHIFDPTPRSIEHFDFCVKSIKEGIEGEYNRRFGGGDRNYNSYIINSGANLQKLFFHDYGVYDNDSSFDFFYPKNRNHVSLSIDNLQETEESISLEVKKIDTIMKELGHWRVDVIKLNIEGAETKTLLHMLKNTDIRPTYISVKFELARDKGGENNHLIKELQDLLNEKYDTIFSDAPSFNYTFKIKKAVTNNDL